MNSERFSGRYTPSKRAPHPAGSPPYYCVFRTRGFAHRNCKDHKPKLNHNAFGKRVNPNSHQSLRRCTRTCISILPVVEMRNPGQHHSPTVSTMILPHRSTHQLLRFPRPRTPFSHFVQRGCNVKPLFQVNVDGVCRCDIEPVQHASVSRVPTAKGVMAPQCSCRVTRMRNRNLNQSTTSPVAPQKDPVPYPIVPVPERVVVTNNGFNENYRPRCFRHN